MSLNSTILLADEKVANWVCVCKGNWELEVGRLDGAFGFVLSPEGLLRIPVVAVPDACHLSGPFRTCAA